MGAFDNARCRYQLPWPEAADFLWQTKSPPAPFSENWEIREDGTLWHEDVDYEDRSDKTAEPGSFKSLLGMMTPVNQRWVNVPWDGEFEIHNSVERDTGYVWYSVVFWFRDGIVRDTICRKTDE